MKLYTEEQVRRIAKLYRHELKIPTYFDPVYLLEAAINTEKPIELPSDEEIEKEFDTHNEWYYIFSEGAKWMKEQILNQNK